MTAARRTPARSLTLLAALAVTGPLPAQAPADDAYSRTCAACHGPELRGGETGPALIGQAFQQKWGSVPAHILELFTRGSMPPTNPGGLSPADYASAVARHRRANGWGLRRTNPLSAPSGGLRP